MQVYLQSLPNRSLSYAKIQQQTQLIWKMISFFAHYTIYTANKNMRNETLTHNIRLYSAQNFSFLIMRSGILAMWRANILYARRHIMLFTFPFLFMAFLSTLCTFARNTMIFNMLHGVYTKPFHIHSCLHLSADKAYSLAPERRNSIGGENILLVRHFFLSPYTEMTRCQCK